MSQPRPVRLIGGRRAWLLVLLSVALAGGLGLAVARAQGPICRDVGNLTVCGDELTELTANGGGFRLRSNVTIGPRGGQPVVKVLSIGNIFDGTVLSENITTGSFFHFSQPDASTGATDFLIGDVAMVNDPTGLALLGSSVVSVPGAANEVRIGRLFVDVVNRKIFNPPAGAVPIFSQEGIARNANIHLAFVSRVGAFSFFRDGGSVNERTLVNGEFDLTARTFKGTVPVDLKLNQQAENPNLRITMRATFSETGAFTGSVDGFKFALAGLVMEASGVTITAGSATTPATFRAGLVKVLKADNQDVPSLDPTDPSLIFSFTNLGYRAGAFEIGGVEVPIKDWEFGNAFKMTGQTLGLINEAGVQAIQIKSTMAFFGDDADPRRKVPIVLKIGRSEVAPGTFRPVFAAGLQNIEPRIGTLTFKLQGAVFSGSAAENFWGLKATSAALQWPPHLGGQTAAGVSNFRLGVELDASKNKRLKVALGGGTFSLPPFESQVFQGTLGATVGVISDTLVLTGTGLFTFKLPNTGNSAGVQTAAILRYGKGVTASPPPPATSPTTCRRLNQLIPCPEPGVPPPPTGVRELELKLSGFNIKVAGFGLTITSPRGLPDGGFAADSVAASLPAGIIFDNVGGGAGTNGFTVQGFAVLGNGEVVVQGGGFEIAPIKFGSYQFVGLKGTFSRRAEGGYEFKAGGKLPLPGIEPGANGGGISAEVRIRTRPDNSVEGFGVTVEFTAGGVIPKIRLPGTGMSITTITGSFDINSGQATIAVGLKATSDLALPLGSLGSLPLVTAQGTLSVQAPPVFKMSANASLSVLIFQVATASVNIGQGYGFSGPGLDVTFTINTLFIDGSAHLRVGEVTLSDGTKKFRAQGDASVSVVVPEGIFAGLPREDRVLASVSVGFGQYIDTKNSNRKSAGVLAMGSLSLIGTVGGFLDMGAQPANLIFFKDANRFQPVPAALLRQRAAAGVAGYASGALSLAESRRLGYGEVIQQESVSYTLAASTRLLATIEYTGSLGAAQIRLRLPDGSTLTPAGANGTTQIYGAESDAAGGVLAFALQAAAPGSYQLLVDSPPADYTAHFLELNQPPTAAISGEACGGPSIPGVTVTCPGGGSPSQVSFSWTAADLDSAGVTVDVGYATVISGTVDNSTFTVLQAGLPAGAGSFTWDLAEVPSGSYRVMIEVSNTSGPPVRAHGSQLIEVLDRRAPAVPAGLAATPLANELSLTWAQNDERDLAGYEVGMGVVEAGQADSVERFFYTRAMGPKEVIVGTADLVDAKLWGIPDGVEVFYAVRAYDLSGNLSAWSPILRGRPWALSPATWTPVPGGAGAYAVEVAFDTPLDAASLQGALTVRAADGTPIAGATYLLTDDSGANIIGVGLAPAAMVEGQFTATLRGGEAGVRAADGRAMGGDYSWSFTLQPYRLLLPLVRR